MSDVTEPVLFDCGCLITCDVIDGVNTTIFSPCRLNCDKLRLFTEEAVEQGVPIERRTL